MTVYGESREESRSPIRLSNASLTLPKSTLRVGCWNVRTLFQVGKTANVVNEFRKYRLDILGLSEMRWTGFGELKTSTGECILYSGSEEEHQRGVGLVLKKEARTTLLRWSPVSDRIMSARFNSRYARLTVILIYAPTNDAEEGVKDEFYEQLQKEVERTPRHDVLIIMGDANAKVGKDNEGWERVMGRQGIGTMNENGERLAEFCALNDLVIGGTLFKHRDIHKLTWISPNGHDCNQIDHIIVNGRYKRSLLDTRAMRGADANSDHHLVLARLKLKLCRVKRERKDGRKLYDTMKLRDQQIKEQFRIEVRNRFEALANNEDDSNEDDSIEHGWSQFKKVYSESAEAVLGERRRIKSDWISAETYRRMEERRQIKEQLGRVRSERLKEQKRGEYRRKDKEVKTSARADKRRMVDNIAEEAENAARGNKIGDLYRLTKQIVQTKRNAMTAIRDKCGKLLTNEEEILERWKEHFDEVLNVDSARTDLPNGIGPGAAQQLPEVTTSEISEAEIRGVISRLKNRKSPGKDSINAEMLKCTQDTAIKKLHKLFNKIMAEQKVPSDWRRSLIVKIPKKGNLTICDNYRGISLLSVPSKIFCRILIDRIKMGVDEKLRQEQSGFRQGRGTLEQIFTLRNILEQCMEWQAPIYVNFVDFRKAFDSVIREKLWVIMKEYGIPSLYINIIRDLYDQSSSCILEGNRTSDWFEVRSGVKQGCVMSGFIFVIVIDWVMRNTLDKRRGLRWNLTTVLEDLDYADDIALLASRHSDLQEKTSRLHDTAEIVGLSINPRKTKTMRLNCKNSDSIIVEGNELEDVETFPYLGAMLDKQGGTATDIKRRLALARNAFSTLQPLWKSSKYSFKTKLRIFNTNVVAVLLYGAETWRTNVADMNKLDAFHRKCMRKILKVFWPNQITNEELYHQTNTQPLSVTIKIRRWRWIGHVLRRDGNNIARTALNWAPEGKRRRGRPRVTWRRSVERQREEMGWKSWAGAAAAARDREGWRAVLNGLKRPSGREEVK